MIPEQVAAQLPNYRRIEIWAALAAVFLLVLLVETVRRRRLRESYSLLWFASVIGGLVVTWKREWLEWLSYGLGIYHAPSALLLVLIGFMFVILFHFSTVISRALTDRRKLAQRMGLLDARCRALERRLAELGLAAEPRSAAAAEVDDGRAP